jgi:uncharacterized lipoprotein YmbA
MVFQLTPNQVRISEEERWAEPLANAISRTLAADLAHRMPQSDIWLDGVGTPGRADLRVKLVVLQFAAVPGQHLDVQLRWAVANLGDRTDDRVLGQVHDYHEPLGSDGGEGLARALSRVVDQVSAEIAQALQHSQGTEGTH